MIRTDDKWIGSYNESITIKSHYNPSTYYRGFDVFFYSIYFSNPAFRKYSKFYPAFQLYRLELSLFFVLSSYQWFVCGNVPPPKRLANLLESTKLPMRPLPATTFLKYRFVQLLNCHQARLYPFRKVWHQQSCAAGISSCWPDRQRPKRFSRNSKLL